MRLNLLFLYLGEAVAKVVALLAYGYLTRVLTDEARELHFYAYLAFPIGTFFILTQILDGGLNPYGTREASRHPGEVSRLAGQILFLRIGIVGLAWLTLGTLFLTLDRPLVVRQLLLLYGIAVIPQAFNLSWVFESRHEMHLVAAARMLQQFVFAACIFTLVHGPEDILRVPLCEAAGWLTQVTLATVFFLRRGESLHPLRFVRGAARVLRESLPLGASTIFLSIRWFAPLLALPSVVASTGHFEAAHRFVIALHTFAWLYIVNLFPSIARLTDPESRGAYQRLMRLSLQVVSWIVLPATLVGWAIAPFLMPVVYDASFETTARLFRMLAWMVFVSFLSQHYRYSLIAFGHQKDDMRSNVAGLVVCLGGIGVLHLLGKLTPEGAAIAFVAAEVASLVTARAFLTHHLQRDLPLVRAVAPAAGAAGVVAVLWWLLHPGAVLASCLVVAVYAAALLLARPEILPARLRRAAAPPG